MSIFYSYAELDEIGEAIVQSYYKKSDIPPLCVDVEGLAQEYLKLPIYYVPFAEDDPDKIGFIADGKTPIKVMDNGKRVVRTYKRGTILIEKALLSQQELGRRRFTIAHEIAHYLIDNSLKAANFSRVFDKERIYTYDELRDILNINEVQVDILAASVLMPKSSVLYLFHQITGKKKIPLYGNSVLDHEDRLLIRALAKRMATSVMAMTNRLRDLNLYDNKPIDEYVCKVVIAGGESCKM